MFFGNAAVHYLPPMVVYKAQNLYTWWTQGGPAGSLYSVSKNGWFDGETFQQWFFNIFLSEAQKTEGNNIVIGDNLGSHFPPSKVIQGTIENDIKFVTLPPNSTHLEERKSLQTLYSKREFSFALEQTIQHDNGAKPRFSDTGLACTL